MRLETKVGGFVLMAIVLMCAGAIYLGNISIFGSGYTLTVYFNFAGDLRVRAKVKMAGGESIGYVNRIENDAGTGRAKILTLIREGVKVRRNADFTIMTSGMMGEKYINVSGGTNEGGYVDPGESVVGVTPQGLDVMMGKMAGATDEVITTLKSLTQLLASDDMKKAVQGLSKTMMSINQLVEEIRPRMAKSMANLETTTASVSKVAVSMDHLAERINELASTKNVAQMQATVDHLAKTAEALEKTLQSVQKTVDNIQKGYGPVGVLLQDPEAAKDLKLLLKKLSDDPSLIGARILSGPPKKP